MRAITTDHDEFLDGLVIEHGIIVLTHEGGEKGRRYPNGVITLRSDLGPVNRRCTLAHEIAHHVAGDVPSSDEWVTARQERRAWEQAAKWLISPTEYALAERLHGAHTSAIAEELGVTNQLLTYWQNSQTRIKEAS